MEGGGGGRRGCMDKKGGGETWNVWLSRERVMSSNAVVSFTIRIFIKMKFFYITTTPTVNSS